MGYIMNVLLKTFMKVDNFLGSTGLKVADKLRSRALPKRLVDEITASGLVLGKNQRRSLLNYLHLQRLGKIDTLAGKLMEFSKFNPSPDAGDVFIALGEATSGCFRNTTLSGIKSEALSNNMFAFKPEAITPQIKAITDNYYRRSIFRI